MGGTETIMILHKKGTQIMSNLNFKRIGKVYAGGIRSVSNFNLSIENEEFIIIVGPSGCGKSTVLRMIAGLEEISEGELYIDDKLVNDVEPKDRDIAMVFQNYALYPHMSIYDNMAFGLKIRKTPKKEIETRVKKAAAILGIEELLQRKPKALSGGQRQRVALGRAIVRNPKVFLMDEPLSNLDAKLRVQTRSEIVKLHKRLKTTFIYVTHDQTEAMTMGDKIVVMKEGVIQQFASPQEIYDFPINMFVAGFIGSPQMNFIEGTLVQSEQSLFFQRNENRLELDSNVCERLHEKGYTGRSVFMGVRPEEVRINDGMKENGLSGVVEVVENMGSEKILYLNNGNENISAKVGRETRVEPGDSVSIGFNLSKVHFFDKESEDRI
jgi:multiple sugar transport system ATP-binding protein